MLISYVLVLAFLVFYISIEKFVRFGGDAKNISKTKDDKGSTNWLAFTFIGVFSVLLIAPILNYFKLALISNSAPLYFAGGCLMASGAFIRISSIQTLGRFYTRTLHETEQHRLVMDGLYKYIRHPGYLGSILFYLGGGIIAQNIFAMIIILLLVSSTYIYRIHTEEKMLVKMFGEEYVAYSQTSKKLIPFIF